MLPVFTGTPESYIHFWWTILIWFVIAMTVLLIILIVVLYIFIALPLRHIYELLNHGST